MAPATGGGGRGEWTPDSWRGLEAWQQPKWPDQEALGKSLRDLAKAPPLVFAGECRNLQQRLAAAARGEAFVLQGGDCAESFAEFSANHVRDTYRVLLQSSVVMMFGGGVPVVKIGRMAGQFAKPRTSDTEIQDGVELPAYRGDNINGSEFTSEARVPDPDRLVRAYNQSAATLNLLRGFSTGGYAGLNRVSDWNLDFMEASDEGKQFIELARRVDEALQFMQACGIDEGNPVMQTTDFFVNHEALLLDYESALTRQDSTTGDWYDCSAHLVWCGERTRQLDGAHIEFLRGVANPLGVKISQKASPEELLETVTALNPDNVPGRILVIVRMGAENLREKLPGLIRAVEDAGQTVTWVCDPMHGNTETVEGFKTRRYERVRAEVEAFFDVHEQCGSNPGGVHMEMTGENVTECIGGGSSVSSADLPSRYQTHCDPRLNAEQTLELAFYCAKRLRDRKNKRQAEESDNGVLYGLN